EDTEGIPGNQFIFEPDPGTLLERLLPRYVATRLFQAVLESKAREQSSRMVAMRNATDNAEDLIGDFTLAYNKVRQANITREMIEIASGAEARLATRATPDEAHTFCRRSTLSTARGALGGTSIMATAAPPATGKVIQITGPVVDIEFPP